MILRQFIQLFQRTFYGRSIGPEAQQAEGAGRKMQGILAAGDHQAAFPCPLQRNTANQGGQASTNQNHIVFHKPNTAL